jgi:hypothetical protein
VPTGSYESAANILPSATTDTVTMPRVRRPMAGLSGAAPGIGRHLFLQRRGERHGVGHGVVA